MKIIYRTKVVTRYLLKDLFINTRYLRYHINYILIVGLVLRSSVVPTVVFYKVPFVRVSLQLTMPAVCSIFENMHIFLNR